jgi:hypothetical protein
LRNYNKDHCWQYDIRLNNREQDLLEASLTEEEVKDLKISDFVFAHEEKSLIHDEVKNFIIKHEWLGKMSLYPTHYFTARYNGILAGVIIMDMPNAFSKLLGEGTRKIERLISRGACISWSPKNLATALISFSMKWMVKNTRFRLFIAYSDVEAKELGTIYQASNFYYIGKTSGAKKQYKIESGRWVSDRYFRSRSVYKRKAKENGIIWNDDWQQRDRIIWDNIPDDIEQKIRAYAKEYQNSCDEKEIPAKHKYCYVLGSTPKETKFLRKKFEKLNKKKIKPYPKKRGS